MNVSWKRVTKHQVSVCGIIPTTKVQQIYCNSIKSNLIENIINIYSILKIGYSDMTVTQDDLS